MNDRHTKENSEIDIELCAGAGGLALGLQNAGFHSKYLFEWDKHSCETLRANHISKNGILQGEAICIDIQNINWQLDIKKQVRLLSGGIPCQPFSLGGRHMADRDGRNLFPVALKAIRALRPKAVILENVQGLTRPAFRPYFQYILHQLECPSLETGPCETWKEHHARILKHRSNHNYQKEYNISWDVLNAADFGVSQTRKRIFIVTTRADAYPRCELPRPTHSKESLIRDLYTGKYWTRNRIDRSELQFDLPNSVKNSTSCKNLIPWKTTWEVIQDLPEMSFSEQTAKNNHWFIPGARLYKGHKGSYLHWPSKTIKAGVNGVPGGENIILLNKDEFRYYTLREIARIQSFPDEYVFKSRRSHIIKQIGNAVPCLLGHKVGELMFSVLQKEQQLKKGAQV